MYGYSVSELIAAVNETSSIPQLSMAQLFQVIYRCEDIYGGIVGNSLCIDGCIPANNATRDDQCQLSGGPGGTTTVTVTTAAPVSCYKKCMTFCFGGNCTTCMNTMHPPTMTPLLRF
ncbi:hypothetical protein PENARI_c002G02212 [Penicillium arizonense]|uniref:Uncharacterized protein n=1 Tax=Penicillium arizonense TaxID=1835702 RepID=A0A1F5LUL2_PENAI|nr:hypothetical protein PENARI_c002G02212 [Penicillium arizonense]OGE56750.1 hypothetical protein PENARI_c002G02212 [Penicillium arizonense]